MGTFGWTSTFPLRLGGGASEITGNIYDTIRENTGDSLSDDTDAYNVIDDMAAARLLSYAASEIERWKNESDPRLLTTTLERWEQILGIVVPARDSLADRRNRVAARLLAQQGGATVGIYNAAKTAFDPWEITVRFIELSAATMYWPGGTTSSTTPWYSDVARICVEYFPPKNATVEDREKRRRSCRDALDDVIPAWATFEMSENQHGGGFGFFLDVPNVDLLCFRI